MKNDRIPASFAVLSPCGHGNLGDAATMEAVLQNVRRRIPAARFSGITLWPAETHRRHGIPSFPIGAISRPMYVIVTTPGGEGEGAAGTYESERTLSIGKQLLRYAVRLLLPRIVLERLRALVWNVRMELEHIKGAYRHLRELDMLILSGGGQLDDFWGGAWGQPYALMKWAVLSRLTKTRVIILCVGYGTLESWLSRWFVRTALNFSDYLSYRDEGSKKLVHKAGFQGDRSVLPDLAFSLDVSHIEKSVSPQEGLASVCISPMVYCDPRSWPIKDEPVYRDYLQRLADIAEQLINRRTKIVLIASDSADNLAIGDLRDLLVSRMGTKCLAWLELPSISSVDDFLMHAAKSRYLIATRLHGVILGHLVSTPVIALSYDRKVRVLMDMMSQSQYCVDINDFDASQVLTIAEQLEARIIEERANISRRHKEFAMQLSAQYDEVLAMPNLKQSVSPLRPELG